MNENNMLLELMKSEFNNVKTQIETLSENTSNQLGAINETMANHIKKDEDYWKKIDQADGQLGLIKWVGGTGVLALCADRIISYFKH